MATNVLERQVVATNLVEKVVVVTNVFGQDVVATSRVEKTVSVTNVAADPVKDSFVFKPPAPKFSMAVHEDSLGWFTQEGDAPPGMAVRVCHDLSHGGFPDAYRFFCYKDFKENNAFAVKPCWHDLPSENLDSANVLVLPPSPAQVLYNEEEMAVVDRFLAAGGTVVAFADVNENNIWSMNKFFSAYGLEVFVMDEYGSLSKEQRAVPNPAWPTCSAMAKVRPELRPAVFAAPLDEKGAREWSAMVTAGSERRAVLAARRVGKGILVFASSGWYWYKSPRDAQYSLRPVTSSDDKWIWTRLLISAAQNRQIKASTPMGARPATDAPVMLPAGPITIYAAHRWRNNASKLRDIVRQAIPHIERYCGGVLDPGDMRFTKCVLTGTSIWGLVHAGQGTFVTSATFRGFPDRICYLSEFVFSELMRGITSGNGISLSGYIANRVLADMGFPGEMASRINEGKRLDPSFSKYRLENGTTVRDSEGNKVTEGRDEIVRAKDFSALEEIRSRHPDFVPAYLARKKSVYGSLSRAQSIGLLTEVTGEDCFKIFEKYGVVCSREDAVIPPNRLNKPMAQETAEEPIAPDGEGASELKGPYGLVIKAGPGCGVAAKKLLADLERIWLPAALKFYGDPHQGKKPEQAFVVTLERGKNYAYRPGQNEWKGYLPSGRNEFNISLDYLCSAILTRVSEPSWTDFAFYVNRFLSDAVRGGSTAEEKILDDIKVGKEAEGKTRDDYSSLGESQWAAQMKRRWKMWTALEEVRAKDKGFILKYCNLKNQRHAAGKGEKKITWRQMAELMGDAVGFDVVEIFTRHGVDMDQLNARPEASGGGSDGRVRYEKVGAYTWFYTIENGDAVIWRGQNGYNNQTRPAIEPMPRGNVVVPERLGGRQVAAIGNLAFFRCKEMKGVTIPQGVSELRGWAFYDCAELRSVTLPPGLRSIRSHAFAYCPNLSAVDIGECADILGNSFGGCSALARVAVSPRNRKYKESYGAVYTADMRELVFCPRTRRVLTIPQSVVTIGEGACEGCVLLQKVSVPRQVETVGKSAFSMCREIKEIKFEDGIKEVGASAFSFCGMLEKVVFPASLERIGLSLFDGCWNLRLVEFAGNAPVADFSRGSVLGKTSDNLVILVAPGSKGWSAPESTELPQRWPVGAFEDSRPIRNARAGDLPAKNNDVKPKADAESDGAKKDGNDKLSPEFSFIDIRVDKVGKRQVDAMKRMVSEVIEKIDWYMGGAFVPEMEKRKTVIVFDKKRQKSGRFKGAKDLIWLSSADIVKPHSKGVAVRSLIQDLASLALYDCLFYDRPYSRSREEPILKALLDEVFRSTSAAGNGANAFNGLGKFLEIDPKMNRYDFNGMPVGKPRPRKLDKTTMSGMADAKVIWSFQELADKYGNLRRSYWKARLEMKADLANPITIDDIVVLLSIAANENLLDWFLEHGLNKQKLDTRLKMPERPQANPK